MTSHSNTARFSLAPGQLAEAILNRDAVLALIEAQPGISDREIAEAVFGAGTPGQAVNQLCRELAGKGMTRRRLRADGLFGNHLAEAPASVSD